MAIEPSAVTIHDKREIAPTCAMLVGSMMIPDPIMLTATMKVSWIKLMRFATVGSTTGAVACIVCATAESSFRPLYSRTA
jgi:hypothetical protein